MGEGEIKRPTCATCPYWDEPDLDDKFDEDEGRYSQCRRRGPRLHAPSCEELDRNPWWGIWPNVFEHDWCGEHPDFPAYLAARKAADATAAREAE
jgi:hypothetical protein